MRAPDHPHDIPILDEDEPVAGEDLLELEDLLKEATAKSAEEKRLTQARKRLAHISKLDHATKEDERISLLSEIRKLEEGRVWLTVGAVVLLHDQVCGVCGSKHEFFVGWFTDQRHASDPNCRRLVRGKPIERLPERVEHHPLGTVEICANCAESQLAMNIAFGEAPEAL